MDFLSGYVLFKTTVDLPIFTGRNLYHRLLIETLEMVGDEYPDYLMQPLHDNKKYCEGVSGQLITPDNLGSVRDEFIKCNSRLYSANGLDVFEDYSTHKVFRGQWKYQNDYVADSAVVHTKILPKWKVWENFYITGMVNHSSIPGFYKSISIENNSLDCVRILHTLRCSAKNSMEILDNCGGVIQKKIFTSKFSQVLSKKPVYDLFLSYMGFTKNVSSAGKYECNTMENSCVHIKKVLVSKVQPKDKYLMYIDSFIAESNNLLFENGLSDQFIYPQRFLIDSDILALPDEELLPLLKIHKSSFNNLVLDIFKDGLNFNLVKSGDDVCVSWK